MTRKPEQTTRNSWTVTAVCCLVLAFAAVTSPAIASESWVIVDTEARTLTVLSGADILARYDNISLGRGGVGVTRKQGDGKTPVGIFHIAWVNRNSRFRLFFGLDFPNLDHAYRAFTARVIDSSDFMAIKTAFQRQETPPQNTALGGFIGIHGVGDGSERVHDQFNWTDGCVAVTNDQIEELDRWLAVGTKVVIY